MKRIFFLLIAFILIVPLGIYLSDPLFWERYYGLAKASITKESRGTWYSPLETIEGAESVSLPHAQSIADTDSLPALSAEVLATVQDYVATRNSSSFIIWHEGAIVHEHYFGEFDQDAHIVSKSMAKPLATMLVARAIEQGHIRSLDQSASDFIVEWKGTDKEAISVRHILNMASGLWRFYRITMNPYSHFHQSFLSSKHDDVLINKVPLEDTPGTHYDFSQGTSDLIAVLIERATGQRYSEYLSTELLQPIGAAGGQLWLNRENGMAHSGCCTMLPAQTWLRLGILMAENGQWNGKRLLPETLNTEILGGSPANPNYGLNFWLANPYQERRYFIAPAQLQSPGVLQSEPYLADDLFMFDGNGSQVVYIVPSRKLVILRTGNWPISSVDGSEWDNTFLPNTIIRALDETLGIENEDP